MSDGKRRNSFNRNVTILAGGTLLAQVVPLAFSPVVSRLYDPDDFGRFGLYIAVLTILAAVFTGQYELAINVPARHETARAVVGVCVRFGAAAAVLSLGVALIFRQDIAQLLNGEWLAPWLFLVPVAALITGGTRALNYWLNRHREFASLSRARIVQAIVTTAATLGLAIWFRDETGLILASLIGALTYLGMFAFSTRRSTEASLGISTAEERRTQAKRFKRFPLLQAPEALLTSSTAQLPIILLTAFFGTTSAGWFALAQRTIRVPSGVLGSSVAEVYRQQINEELAAGSSAEPLFWNTFKKLFVVSFIPFGACLLVAPWAFEFVFGNEWRSAGDYARIMVPALWSSFVVGPLSIAIIAAEKHHWDLLLQGCGFVLGVLSLWLGHIWFDSDRAALLLFSIASALKSAVEFRLSLLAARNTPELVP